MTTSHGKSPILELHPHVLTLSFSLSSPKKLPVSFKNIYKQLASDMPALSPPKTVLVTSFLLLPFLQVSFLALLIP